MPLVLPSSSSNRRPEDAHLLHLRKAAIQHRSQSRTFSHSQALEIEKRQKLAYERSTKKPALPKPKKPAASIFSNDEGLERSAGGAAQGLSGVKSFSASIDGEYSEPEWEPARSCWLVYNRSNSAEWKAWRPLEEKWVDLGDFDSSCSSPDSPEGNRERKRTRLSVQSASGLDVSATKEKGEQRAVSRSASLPERMAPKFSFKSVAQAAWKVLAWKRRAGGNGSRGESV